MERYPGLVSQVVQRPSVGGPVGVAQSAFEGEQPREDLRQLLHPTERYVRPERESAHEADNRSEGDESRWREASLHTCGRRAAAVAAQQKHEDRRHEVEKDVLEVEQRREKRPAQQRVRLRGEELCQAAQKQCVEHPVVLKVHMVDKQQPGVADGKRDSQSLASGTVRVKAAAEPRGGASQRTVQGDDAQALKKHSASGRVAQIGHHEHLRVEQHRRPGQNPLHRRKEWRVIQRPFGQVFVVPARER